MIPKLAIVIPYYKVDFFKETLRSIEEQTSKEFDLFIGDDASEDDPKNLISEILKTTKYQYKRYPKNLGGKNLVSHWNRVLKDAQNNDWFMILGDDDVLAKNFVEEFYRHLSEIEKVGSNIVKFSQCWINEDSTPTTEFSHYARTLTPFENWMYKFIHGHRSSLSEHVFRRSSFEQYGFKKFPLAWHSDDFAIIQCSENQRIFFIETAKVFVRMSEKSISGSSKGEDQKQLAGYQYYGLLLNQYYRQLPKNFVQAKTTQQINFAYRNRLPLNINLAKIYWNLGDYKSLLKVPRTLYYINQRM